jgi:hypothetical protein
MAAINRSVALNVVANVEGYQREFMKLPGITEKQATAAALKMVNAFSRAEAKIAVDSAKAAQRATRTITTSTTRATRAMAAAGRSSAATMTQATQAVAIQIPDVITQLSMGTSPMQVLIQQGLQPVQVMLPQIMSALSGLGTAFGVAGIAVAAAGTAYVVFANAAEEAAEANGRLTARVEEATSAHNRAITAANGHARAELALSRAIVEAERATSVILGEISKEESERIGLVETIDAQSHAMIRDASLAVSQGERRQQAIKNELRSTEISFERRTTLIDQLGTVEEQLDRDRKRFADAQAQRDAAIEAGTNRLFEQLSAERAKEAAKVEETERKKREALRKTADEERRAAEERAAREAEAATEALAGLESQLARDQAGTARDRGNPRHVATHDRARVRHRGTTDRRDRGPARRDAGKTHGADRGRRAGRGRDPTADERRDPVVDHGPDLDHLVGIHAVRSPAGRDEPRGRPPVVRRREGAKHRRGHHEHASRRGAGVERLPIPRECRGRRPRGRHRRDPGRHDRIATAVLRCRTAPRRRPWAPRACGH